MRYNKKKYKMSEDRKENKDRKKNKDHRRISTCLENHSNYKRIRFFPYSDNQKFYTRDGKTRDIMKKWVDNVEKTRSELDANIVLCESNGRKININPVFPRKLKDGFIPRRPNRIYLEHQKVLQNKFKENLPETYLLYWEMGSGKTLGILSALLLLDEIPPKITIVCAISMIDYWVSNILDFNSKNQTFEVEVMGYSYFENKFLEDLDENNMIKELSKRVIIIDEAHNYRNMSSNMERALRKYSYAKQLYLLTGTPLVNSANELRMWASFLKINNKAPPIDSPNSKNIEWINSNLKDKIMYFNPVMNQNMQDNESYPEVEEKTLKIEMTWKQTLIYFLSEGTVTFKGTQIISAKKNNGLSLHKQVANGFKDKIKGFVSPKNEFIIEANNNPKEYPFPHVIFSGNLETGVEDIYSKLKKNDPTISIITGNTNAIKRQEIVDEYNQGKIKNLLISRVGNEGINLLGTGTLFITTRHDNEESANQTKARVVRYESHSNSDLKKVKIVDLLSVFPTKDPIKEDKEELVRYMSELLGYKISGEDILSELKLKIKQSKNETVEEHLNKLNKQKEAILNPVLDSFKDNGKQWWNQKNKQKDQEKQKKEEEKLMKEKNKEAEKAEREERREAEKAEREERKEAEKAEREERKEAEKAEREERREAEKAEREERKEAEKILKEKEKIKKKEERSKKKEVKRSLKKNNNKHKISPKKSLTKSFAIVVR